MNASFGENINELIDSIHRIAPRMLYVFDCAINMCLMSPELYNKFLLNPKIMGLSTECQNPVFDIGVDFSTSWCACFDDHSRLKIKNIFEYRNMQHMYNDMLRIMFEESKALNGECDSKNCSNTYSSGVCQGILYRIQKEKE